jgi:predicted nucleic acid-binding Zn ribbon protein
VTDPDENDAEPPVEAHRDEGLELARSIARSLASRLPSARRRDRRLGARGQRGRFAGPAGMSGAHPDDRDPQTLDASLGRFVAEQGWDTELRVHGVFSRWEAIVGADVGRHVKPEAFADGRLTVRTDSTAWATQMKLLAADVVRRLNQVLGDGTVEVIDVQGPYTPSWSRGRWRVKGRGPRDTYG